MGYKFEKFNTVDDVEIFGYKFKVDFGSDETANAIDEAAEKVTEANKSIKRHDFDSLKDYQNTLYKTIKEIYKNAFIIILGDDAVEKIFTDNSSMILYNELFIFINNAFKDMQRKILSAYSPERANRK